MARRRAPETYPDPRGSAVRLTVPKPGKWSTSVRIVEPKGAWLTHLTPEDEDEISWLVTCGLVPSAGQPVIEWMDIRGWPEEESTPRRGIRARTLRRIPLGEGLEIVYRTMTDNGFFQHLSRIAGFEASRATRGRTAELDDVFFASLARDYVATLARAGGRPREPIISTLATLHHRSESRTRDLVWEARKRGFLTPPPGKGLPGGELTEIAEAVLRGQQPTKSQRPARPGTGKGKRQ